MAAACLALHRSSLSSACCLVKPLALASVCIQKLKGEIKSGSAKAAEYEQRISELEAEIQVGKRVGLCLFAAPAVAFWLLLTDNQWWLSPACKIGKRWSSAARHLAPA